MFALTSVAQVVGRHPAEWKVTGLIPGQGTCPGCGFDPQLGYVQEGNQSMFLSYINISLSFSLSQSLKAVKKYP